MELIFGSVAAKHWFPDFREPKDLDLMSESGKMSREEQAYWVPTFQEIIDRNKDPKYLDPEFLYTIKCSHFGWDIWWEKTAADILFFQRKGLKLDRELYKKLVKDWKKVHGKRWASLKGKDSETFFMDAVKRDFNHDEVHEVVATQGKPLYYKFLKYPETKSVECCEQKFNLISEEEKVIAVREEIWVTALERYLVPAEFKFSRALAYHRSLKKLLTTMSSGWFKMWMIENYNKINKNDDWTFIDKFKTRYGY